MWLIGEKQIATNFSLISIANSPQERKMFYTLLFLQLLCYTIQNYDLFSDLLLLNT